MNLQPLSVDLTLSYEQNKHLLPSYSLDKHSFMHSMAPLIAERLECLKTIVTVRRS